MIEHMKELKNTMRKVGILALLLLMGQGLSFAQVEMSIAGELTPRPMDQDARVYYKQMDANDNVCALIKVKPSNPMGAALVLQTGGGLAPVPPPKGATNKQSDGSWWYWLSPNTRNIFFTAAGYKETARLGVRLEAGKVYELTLAVGAALTVIQTTSLNKAVMKLSISPKDCVVSFGTDDHFDMGRKTINDGYFDEVLRKGTYKFKIENPLYETYIGTYVLNSSSSEQTITLRPAFGLLCIESDPSGADVYLDGAAQSVGKTPYTTGRLPKGKHQIQLYKEDYYGYSAELEVLPDGQEQKIPTIQLKPQFGWVTCQCDDAEALLTITDARERVMGKGKSGLKVKLNSRGDYRLEASKSSHASQSVTIQGGSNIEGKNCLVRVEAPVPLYGTLQLSTEPSRADVFVDGKKMGQSMFLKQLLIGEHSIELQKEGYQPMKFSVNIQKDETVDLKKTLTAGPLKKTITLVTQNAYLYLDGKELAFRSWTGELEIGRKYKVTTHTHTENYEDGEREIVVVENGPNTFAVPVPAFTGGWLTIKSNGYRIAVIQTSAGKTIRSVSIPCSDVQLPAGRYVVIIHGNDQWKECKHSFSVKQGVETVVTMNPQEKKMQKKEPVLVRIPMLWDLGSMSKYGFSVALGSGLGIGGYNNLFNMDFLVSYHITNTKQQQSLVGYKLTAYPSFNVLKTEYLGDTAHLNVGPYYEWHNKLGHFFGARIGFGWHFSDFSIGLSYGTQSIFAFDFRMRVNIHLFRL